MSNHIDQERDPFASKLNGITESLLETANAGLKNALGQIEKLRAENARLVAELELARAQLPAGGAVPYTLTEQAPFVIRDAQGRYVAELLAWDAELIGEMLAAAPHPVSGEQKIAFDAEWLVKILDSGEWRLTRFQYDKSLTHEANTRSPWQIERQTPPFCDRQDVSFWRGKTPEHALMAAIWALFPASAQNMGIPFTVCALAAHRAQAQGGDV